MIRSELDVLLDRVDDPALRADLRKQIERLQARRSFGLVFEHHIPERVRLPQHPVGVGSQVVSRDDDDSPTWEVIAITDGLARLRLLRGPDGAYLAWTEHATAEQERMPVDSLVVMSDFGEPVLPGFRHLGSIDRGGDKPYHTVIKGENHHALEALRFTHVGKVDCIYIDPPYNSGARDWKYNNDYVDDADAYRHSKWLAFMERRLKLAKELLNPDDSVLIVTIDEKEYLRLGLLLDQVFPSARITMVTSSINSAGATRKGTFPRASEYLYFAQFGASRPVPLELGVDWNPVKTDNKLDIYWSRLIRSGADSARSDSRNQFYPIFIRNGQDGPIVESIGDPYYGDDRSEVHEAAGVAIWPIRRDGSEGRWRVSAAVLRDLVTQGHVRLGQWREADTTVYYLKQGERQKVISGSFSVVGRRQDGSVITDASQYTTRFLPTDVWRITSHDAGNSGSRLIDRFIPGRAFPFPKSLYAVEDTIRFFVKDKPEAVVLDFFAGSGTTAHAVARLNRQDGGRRQSIMVTNNEVSASEAQELRKHGVRPGDAEWEALGIFEHITRPRVTAAITGQTPDGEPVKGDYKFTDEFPMAEGFEENVAFLELRYLDADGVDLLEAFDDLAPLLWLRAGARGPIASRIDANGATVPYVWTESHGVLFDVDEWRAFVTSRPESAVAAFIVTYSPTTFTGIAAELPGSLDTVRLYDTYLSMYLPHRGTRLMRYELRDYQRDAALEILKRLRRAHRDILDEGERSSFALSAITGSGKTVIATAVIEALLFGSTDLDTPSDPRATFLWITDDPALNRQTRGRMLESSELLTPWSLREVDESFPDADLAPGRVYFLNTQKLSRTSRLVQCGTNVREVSFWDVLRNTIGGGHADLVMVLDEAHRGMKRTTDRQTIVRRLIEGEAGSNPPMPVIWGISATIERFTRAMGEVTDRNRLTNVAVDIERVRASGLVKDEIGLDQPDEQGTFSTTLLREAVRTTLSYQQRWAAYSAAESEPDVLPVLVVQVPDRSTVAKLTDIVSGIDQEWPGLGPGAIAHVFGEHEPITLGSRTIDWVYPESIQADTTIRVVLAKEAISTGWDCPRAEVLYSERPASDATHIAQVIGRMVRQPLAHRIATDDALNSVMCYLPLFDRAALTAIKDELEGKGIDNGQNAVGATVVRSPKVFERNGALDAAVFEFVESLPSVPTPDRSASPLRRARTLARLLADGAGGAALLGGADGLLTAKLNARLDGLAAEYAVAAAANVQDLLTADVRTSRVTTIGEDTGTSIRQVETHTRDVARDSQRIIDSIREGVGKGWYAHRVTEAPTADRAQLRVEVAAVLRIPEVIAGVEDTATDWVQSQLNTFRVAIKNTTGATRDAYLRVQEQTAVPEAVTIMLRTNERAATRDASGGPLPRFARHLFSDADGLFPAQLNDWERAVLAAETARSSFVAWYRNPGSATPASLRIAYENDAKTWVSLQPDFIMVSRRSDGSLGASVVDPHGDHLADARAKLRALADYAERHGDAFVRIESVARVGDGSLRSLDLTEASVRDAVRAFEGGKVTALYESSTAKPYL